MKKVYITGIGQDRPGIVSKITQVVTTNGGNIEDSTMTLLGSQFASIMVGSFPDDTAIESVEKGFQALESELGLQFSIKALLDEGEIYKNEVEEDPYIISVAGHDKAGITFEVTHILSKHQISITDLNAHTILGEDGPVYIMMVECILPKDLQRPLFERELALMGENLNVEITYHSVEQVAL